MTRLSRSYRCAPVRAVLTVLAMTALLAPSPAAVAATLPAGFTEVTFASGLSNPTAMQFAPDGRLFVCEQGGTLRVVKNGTLLPTPFVSLAVEQMGERGLLGVAFDPNFAVNQYVYVYYTVNDGGGNAHNRIARFTANGDVALAGSQLNLIELDSLTGGNIHNGGALSFGADGTLYVAVGDNANSANAQSLSTRHGKILRYHTDGSIPTDNPFYNTASGANRAIWAMGLRNPFTFALNPGGTPAMAINDVGQDTWEEVNIGVPGANFGWPSTEGDFNPATFPAYTRPHLAYRHSGAAVTGCAVTGGAFYNPAAPTFPAQYQGMYFFADYCGNWIKYVDPTAVFPNRNQPTVSDFATGINAPVDLKVGADGALYYLARGAGAVFRVQYGSSAPAITTQPADRTVPLGQSASFSVVASGAPPLAYQWQRNSQDIPGATSASYTFPNAQLVNNGDTFRVQVSNGAGNVLSNAATLTVTTNTAPTATITAPDTALLYTGGMTVQFAGTGTDAEEGVRPASAFTWRVDFHHDTHSHPFIPATSGITSGEFTVPVTGETSANVWYRISLTVTDSEGLSSTVIRDVHPRRARLTLAASPPGLQLTLDGQPVTAPAAFDSVVGIQRTIGAAAQSAGGTTYAFVGWSDGGPPVRVVATPAVDTTFTATFRADSVSASPATPTGFTAIVNGATVRLTWQRSAGAQGYRLEAGTAVGLADLANADMGDITSFEGLVPIGTYFVRVRAVNAVGTSPPTNDVQVAVTTTAACTTAPPVPPGFTGQAGGLLASLTWLAAPAATGYVLDIGVASGTTFTSAPLGNVTALQVVGPAGTWFTRLRAVNACGSSGPSVEVPLTLACSATAVVPGTLTVTTAGGVATFAWVAPLGATSYRLQVGTAPGASDIGDVDVGAVTVLPVPLAGVPPATYYVRVAAVSACGVSVPSNEVAITVP
jgi:glucose/arabinose dehydrogenase